jgi:hypothetical protein
VEVTAIPIALDEVDRWLAEAKDLQTQHKYDLASIAIEKAYRIAPMAPRVWYAASLLRMRQQDYRWAIITLTECHNAIPNNADVCYNAGICAMALGEYHYGKRWFQRAASRKPKGAAIRAALASAYSVLGETVASRNAYGKVLECDKTAPDDRFAHALTHLLRGDWKEGFELYESRFDLPGFEPHRKVDLPRWTGVEPGRVLVVSEQGMGDTIMMERYLGHIPGAVVSVQGPLFTWFVERGHVAWIDDAQVHKCDYWIPMMSLPHIFGVIPPADSSYWHPGLKRYRPSTPPRVGICWSGNPAHPNDKDRSMPQPYEFDLMRSLPEVEWVNLTHGVGRFSAKDNWGLNPYRPESWLATAELMETLDAVVSIDSGVAHMAGTLGLPTVMLPPSAPEWRWGSGETTPWYPSMTLVRRKHTNDWPDAIRRAAKILKEML